jgi:hypothetical protein
VPEPVVKNAGDPAQVKRARRLENRREAFASGMLHAVLDTVAGRAFVWDLISRAGVFASPFRLTDEIYYLVGRADFGRELLARCVESDNELYILMEREARERAAREQAETDAAHTARAEQGAD